jgi:hypothetical protein
MWMVRLIQDKLHLFLPEEKADPLIPQKQPGNQSPLPLVVAG